MADAAIMASVAVWGIKVHNPPSRLISLVPVS